VIQKLNFKPGIVRDATEYANSGGWYACDKVRFRMGYPEKIGGWTAVTRQKYAGTCRCLHEWSSLEYDRYLGLGTNERLYILWGNSYYDITPLRANFSPLPADTAAGGGTTGPFKTYQTPNLVLVHIPAHGAHTGDIVRFSGATTAVDVFTTAQLNAEFVVQQVPDPDHVVIQMPGGSMTATGITGGGTAVTAAFPIPSGLDNAIIGMGWGVPPWGGTSPLITQIDPGTSQPYKTGWGDKFDPRWMSSDIGAPVNQLRLWDLDNFGEDLVANIRGGGIYYWHQNSTLSQPAVLLNQTITVAGVTFTPNQAPNVATQILVSPNDRHLIAMGCDDTNTNKVPDPMLVRWSSEEDAYDWQPRRDNTAGGQRLSVGSYIICGLRTRQEILIWTDQGLWSQKYIGVPYVFGFDVIGEGLSIIGPNAAVNAGNMVAWMDRGIFYAYSGAVQELPCTVKDYIFSDLNYTQSYKIICGHNHQFSEIGWFYPSSQSDEIDRYVIYDYKDQDWTIGNLSRTAWLDMGRANYPVGAAQNTLYYHEYGDDADGDPLPAWIESADLDADGGDHFLFVSRVLPDVQFRGADSSQQAVGLTLLTRRSPGEQKFPAARVEITPITVQQFVRLRARQVSVRVESDALGVGWRLGTLRLDMQPDGKK